MLEARKFVVAKNLLKSVVIDQNLEYPILDLVSVVEECGSKSEFLPKLYDLLMRVYAHSKQIDDAFKVFDYMSERGFQVEERSCMVCLVSLKSCGEFKQLIKFFTRMVESGVKLTSLVIDFLCKRGEIEKAKQLIGELGSKNIKHTVYPYHPMMEFYIRNQEFRKVDEVLELMQQENVEPNVATYTVLERI